MQPYRDLGEDYFDRVDKDRAARAMLKRLDRLGYQVKVLDVQSQTATVPKRKLPWAVAAVLPLDLVVLSGLFWRTTRLVERPLTRFSVDLRPEAVAGVRVTAAISPDGRRLSFVARGAGGKEQLATPLLDQANPTLLSGTDNAVDPFFSPTANGSGSLPTAK